MADYANGILTATYTRSVTNGTAATFYLNPPPGTSKFRVLDINASVTTSFNSTSMTVPATIGVGVANNTSIAGQLSFGVAGTGAATGAATGWGLSTTGAQATLGATGNDNATPYNKTTNSNGSALVGTVNALTTGSNNPVVALIELTGANNTALTAQSNGFFVGSAELQGPALITFTGSTGGTTAGAAVVDVTLGWF